MRKKCESHQTYDEEYICIEKSKLKKEGNKFSCIKCINLQNPSVYLKNMEELQIEAKDNVVKYVEMQNKIINSNNELKEKYLQSLNELLQKLNQYLSRQQKSINTLFEQQNQILTRNINQANQHLKKETVLDSQSLDNFIFFAQLNQDSQDIIENKYNHINECLQRQFNYEITEIQFRVNQFTTMEIKFDNVPKYEVEQFNIQTEEEDQLSYCQDHNEKKKYICIHENCLNEQQQEYLCEDCVKNHHDQHQKSKLIKKLKKIKEEQTEKLKKIQEEYKEYKNQFKEELTQNQQQKIFDVNQKIRENLKLLETSIIINPFQNPKYINQNIDLKLLSYNDKNIRLEFTSKIDQLEQQIQQINTPIKQEELYEKCQAIEDQQQTYKTETFKLTTIVQQQEKEISELQKKVEETSNESKITEIQTQLCSLQKELKSSINQELQSQIQLITTLQQSTQQGIGEIKQQIQKVPTKDSENQQFISLQKELNNSITILQQSTQQGIGEIKQQIQTKDSENQQFISLQKELKNSITILQQSTQQGIGEIKQQIQKVPTKDSENQQFISLQKELNNSITILQQSTQQGIGEIKQQIQKVPTIDSQKELQSSIIQEINKVAMTQSQVGQQQMCNQKNDDLPQGRNYVNFSNTFRGNYQPQQQQPKIPQNLK